MSKVHDSYIRTYCIGDYKKSYKGYRSEDVNAPSDKYVQIMYDVFVEIHKMIIRDTQYFKMPFNLGDIRIIGIGNKAAVNMSHFMKTGVVKKLTNLHTNREIYKFVWKINKQKSPINMRFYKYTPPLDYKTKLTGKRGLARWIQECAADPKRPDFIPYLNI